MQYRVPSRNLACSDISFVDIEIDPGTSAPANSHAGTELRIPLADVLSLELNGRFTARVEADRESFTTTPKLFIASSMRAIERRGLW
jgi:hypothetical protein